ncbi:MAG TPA: extracellular solute-binding protein [Candidatus Binatia bacterium]|nr:extracellular solute-binding protein [Candidatus Binatia bacterium]
MSFHRWLAATLSVAVLAFLPATVPAAVSSDVLAAAKREGSVVWYTTLDDKTLAAISARFEQLYPDITLKTLVLSTRVMGPRLIAEQRGRNVVADLVEGDGFQINQLVSVGILQSYRPSEAGKYLKGAVEANGYYTSLYEDALVIAWNPARVKADGLKPPGTLADFTKPEWKHHIGISAASFSWLAGLQQTQSNVPDLMRKLAANNPFISANHFNVMSQLEAGEFDATPTGYGHLADLDRKAGKPVEFTLLRPQLLSPIVVGLVANAPHPNAARVMLEWLLSRDGQQLIVQVSGRTSARTDVANNPALFNAKLPYFVVPSPDAAEYNTIVKTFNDTFGINAP